MASSIFISYRRTDSQHAAFAVSASLKQAFTDEEVFFDRNSFKGGEIWPDDLREAAAQAKVMLVLIGEGWLTASDKHGRRRIDQTDDWVRQEILTAIHGNSKILVVTLEKAKAPVEDAFDDPDLKKLAAYQPLPIRAV